MRLSLLLFCFLFLHLGSVHAQLNGLWIVTEVKAGDKIVTPVARWTRFHADGNTQSGNGWVQHTVGKWHYNPADSSLSIVSSNGWKDEAGPFKVVQKTGNSMRWQRLEEGVLITVNLHKTENLPQTPSDDILGLWLLNPSDKVQQATGVPQAYALMRWDRRFNFKGIPGGQTYGFWQIDGHQPILTLLADGREEKWRIEILPTTMTWTKIAPAGQEQVLSFTRTDTFPK
ncbi:hypothetical protein [Cesiribacter sp. SM1]|uniref:hypothetical protein n=1 Tax=Cesiribacter sp. SM1 TaxID=2861196 RepID=UPI001CD652D4|nr:hypothetical protein [Cesiribacter sp. SM1]